MRALLVAGPFAGKTAMVTFNEIIRQTVETDHGEPFIMDHIYKLYHLVDSQERGYIYVHWTSGTPADWSQETRDEIMRLCREEDCVVKL